MSDPSRAGSGREQVFVDQAAEPVEILVERDAGANALIPDSQYEEAGAKLQDDVWGADVVVKLVDDVQSGKIEGRTVLTLDIVSLRVNGGEVDVDTTAITEQSSSRTARSGKVIGGTAAQARPRSARRLARPASAWAASAPGLAEANCSNAASPSAQRPS